MKKKTFADLKKSQKLEVIAVDQQKKLKGGTIVDANIIGG